MGDWTPVPWRRVDRKQMLYPLDHDAQIAAMFPNFKWLGFWISLENLFTTIQIPNKSRF